MTNKVSRTFDLLDYMCDLYPEIPIIGYNKNNVWLTISADEYRLKAHWLAISLLKKGFEKGDKIATVSGNRPEWNLLDMAMSLLGIVHVPLFTNQSADQFEFLLSHSEVKAVIIENQELFDIIKPAVDKIKGIEIIMIEDAGDYCMYDDLIKRGKEGYHETKLKIESIKKKIMPDDLSAIIYTSGTTGAMKGVMLSHKNLVSNMVNGFDRFPLKKGDRAISFLPVSHIFERMMVMLYHYSGITVYYARNYSTVIEDAANLEVNGFSAVPGFIEKVFDFIYSSRDNLSVSKKRVFDRALKVGYKYCPDRNRGLWYFIQLQIARKLVFSRWKKLFGGQIKMIVTGSSALQERLARLFWAAGLPIQEGYGLTETSPVITVNGYRKSKTKVGTVGTPINDVQVKINDDGEILCKGPNVMQGYYKDEEATKKVIDQDGWFHTGDVGEIIDDRFLKIIDRKDAFFKLNNGMLISPQSVENVLKKSNFIEHAFICGQNGDYVGAIISPNLNYLQHWAKQKNISYNDLADLISKKPVIEQIKKEINALNSELDDFEKVKEFKVVPDKWTAKNGMLSLTLKMKRKTIYAKYQSEIDALFKS